MSLIKTPIKKIYDSVHRFIHVDPLEAQLIKTPPFQRLHYIHQLGITFFVYPGAKHCRFEHSLGVMELSSRIYDQITAKPPLCDHIPPAGSSLHSYWRRLLRLGALCHDLGHLPFSHAAEKALLGEEGHEKWTEKMVRSACLAPIWEQLAADARTEGIERDVERDVIKIALGEKKCGAPYTPWERVVAEIITGDFFGADRIDYLIRDSQCTGLTYGLFDYYQLIEMIQILLTPQGELLLGVEENGIESCEALLLARHYMHKRLYQYPSVKSYSFHLSRFMGRLYPHIGEDLSEYIQLTDNEVLAALNILSRDPSHSASADARALYQRENRFRALSFTNPPKEEQLLQIQAELAIPDGELAWELQPKRAAPLGLSFPVRRIDGSLDVGESLSEITIPPKERSWIFVAPAYRDALGRALFKQT